MLRNGPVKTACLQGKVAGLMFSRMNQGLQQAIEIAGSQVKLAKLLGITHQAINKWRDVPVHHIIAIERATGVHRSLLRPDLYEEPGQKINL